MTPGSSTELHDGGHHGCTFQRSLGKGRCSAVWMVRFSVLVQTDTGIVAPSLVCAAQRSVMACAGTPVPYYSARPRTRGEAGVGASRVPASKHA